MLHAEDGTCSMNDLVRAAKAIGFRSAAAVRIDPGQVSALPLPAIAYRRGAHPDTGHFMLLSRRQAGFIQVVDYPRCVAWVPLARLNRLDKTWRGEIVLLENPEPAPMTPLRSALIGGSLTCIGAGAWLLGRGVVRRHARRHEAPRKAGKAPGGDAAGVVF